MAIKKSVGKTGLKGGLKAGKRKAVRTPAGTVALYGRALVGDDQARADLRKAYAAARKAYDRSSNRRGRPDLGALLQDRKARREAGNAVASLQQALRTAGRKRRKPRSAKGPVVVAVAVAGTGAAAAAAKHRRDQATAGTEAQAA